MTSALLIEARIIGAVLDNLQILFSLTVAHKQLYVCAHSLQKAYF